MAKFFRVKDADGNPVSMESSESTNNKVDSISSESTDTQYPSAKAVYELVKGHDYSLDYLTFVATSDGTFNFSGSLSGETVNTIQYSTDNGETWSEALSSATVNVNVGDKILWRGEMTPLADLDASITGIGKFGGTASFNAEGNVNSLLYGDNFEGLHVVSQAFLYLFENSNIVSAKNLILDTTTAIDCYGGMFNKCASLIEAPELPALTLTLDCYYLMFRYCTALIKAPNLPAEVLADSCYMQMFYNCTSLTTAPDLLAVQLQGNCYAGMFLNCTSLNYIKMLATDISASYCLSNWAGNVSNSGTFVKSASMTSLPTGNNGIPTGWTVYNEEDYELVRLYQLSNKENTSNKVISISDSSTNEEYPSAKAVYELVKGHDYSQDYLTFVALSDGTFKFYGTGGTNTIQYSIDNGETWSEALLNVTINVNTGDKVLWKGEMVPQNDKSFSGNDITCIGTFIGSTATYNVQGNIMSLLYGDNFIGQISLNEKEEVFVRLFSDLVILDSEPNTNIINAKNLILPATTLTNYCYHSMFNGCTSLTTVPQLPATTLANYCYSEMFKDCASLINPPQLPATTLANYCYHSMFNGCVSLTTAPQLLATTLAEGCYIGMFIGCTSLTTAPQLPATTLNISCYMGMFNGCTSLTTAPSALPATTLTNACYSDMFRNCTSLTQAPELPATTLADGCYSDMFRECTSLKTAPELPATTLVANCYNGMFLSCTSLTTAPQLPATTLANYCYSNMFKSCTNLNCITMLATNISASNCLRNWVKDVATSGTFVKAAEMTALPSGISGIPEGWQVCTEEEYELARQYQLSNKENTSNKVISISSESTDDQYPSAKCVYDLIGNIENLLNEL